MRTDIPAFYSEWLLNRIREGFVLVRNPYHPSQVTRYSLSPDVVDAMAFCTKNPAPMLKVWEECRAQVEGKNASAANSFGLTLPQARLLVDSVYIFVTITPYGKDIEPNVPDKEKVMEDFKRLSDLVGADSMGWRYDPVLIDGEHTVDWHLASFEHMAKTLSGYTKTCVISFIEIYKKVERNFPGVRAVSGSDRQTIGREFVRIGREYGMTIRPCAEGNDLAEYGADCSGCMTVQTFEQAIHAQLNVPKRKTNQRNGQCACLLGVDIGAYDTCGHLCRYCYANANTKLVRDNMKKHDPTSPFLLGHSMPQDVIHEAKQKSWLDGQMSLELY
jgi:hypothetical protein